jgi:hypothetical protein
MNNHDKRGRGRPIGTGKDDSSTLSRVADLIAANPALRPTTAIKRVVARQSGSEGPSIRIRIRDRVVAIVFLMIDAGKRYV